MGAVLAMTGHCDRPRRGVVRMAAALLMLGLLAGCAAGQGGGPLADALSRIGAARAPAGPSLRAQITPEAVAALNQPVILIALPERGAEALARWVGANNGHATWASGDGVSIRIRRGILSATRGLGGDLLSADIADVEAALYAGGPTRVIRIHRYLDGTDQVTIRALVCDITRAGPDTAETAVGGFATTRFDESCSGPDRTFENRYWIGANGQLRKTRQWVGPDVGTIVIERLTGE
ncbi:YjbF family lipoprotein [Cognatishimia sp. F0-27]|uniref:YjbF family lipoprotein n=1 Tax=Cognatishimia sp. F0-27 TaxID=2816855 RepID=UPI001D0C0986|nr:YjbF family lipoprotein [Cognatishimia sp. F0-27]MCC1494755.1 YjbF family lipoprotein [Cognatishimia sp. F0-27]